jgi:uncharacterized coiled-coil protein SlyX
MTGSFRIGFEVPSGKEVAFQPQHLGITGLTQMSGKTTALEGFMARAGETAIAFRTSRGELSFPGAKRISPYFRERTDWRFVEGLISAHLMEKAKFYRGDLIRLTRGTHDLASVHANIRTALSKARSGSFQEKVYTELNEYVSEIREALESVHFDPQPNLTAQTLSVMDLEGLSPAVQQLVIAATVDWLMEGHINAPVIVVLPEARDFIPEDRRTPAKLSLENLIRKGARVQRFLWVDSQSLTGLDMDVMRSVGTWLFGRQVLDLEIKRVLKMAPDRSVKPDAVRSLGLGQFLCVRGEQVTKVYAQPTWLDDLHAVRVAEGIDSAEEMAKLFRPKLKEKDVDEEERKRLKDTIARQSQEIAQLKAQNDHLVETIALQTPRSKLEHAADRAQAAPGQDTIMRGLAGHGSEPKDRERVDLHVTHEVPSMTVHVREVRVEASGDDNNGRVALLIAQGFFDERKSVNEVTKEFRARGWGTWSGGAGWNNMDRILGKFAEQGFLRNIDKGYVLVAAARDRILVKKEG